MLHVAVSQKAMHSVYVSQEMQKIKPSVLYLLQLLVFTQVSVHCMGPGLCLLISGVKLDADFLSDSAGMALSAELLD